MKTAVQRGLIVLCLALWPALAAAEPPKPEGQLIYNDDFSDASKSGLEDNLQATDYSRGFHAPGVYHLILYNPNETHWSLFPNQTYGDFSVELDMWDNSDDFTGDLAQGLIFRATDDSHFYTVLLDPRKGQYAARKLDGQGNWIDLIAWTSSPLVKQKSDVNRVRVDGSGQQFNIYLNGEALDSFSDSAYSRGGLGLIANTVDAVQPHLHFDNMEIYTVEVTAPGLPRSGQTSDSTALLVAFAMLLLGVGVWVRQRS